MLYYAGYCNGWSVFDNIAIAMASKTFMSAKDAKYQSLLDISKKISPEKPYLQLQKEVTDTWKNELESGSNPRLFERKMEMLRAKLSSKKGGIMAFMGRMKKPNEAEKNALEKKKEEEKEEEKEEKDLEVIDDPEVDEEKEWKIDNRKETRVQDELRQRISFLQKKVLLLIEERTIGAGEVRATMLTTEIKNCRAELEMVKKELNRKMIGQKAVQRHRQKKKIFEARLRQENPDLARAMKLRDCVGRPTIEEDNPGESFF